MEMDRLPVINKCCFCVPLRYGLLTWGYLKLATALFVLCCYIIIMTVLGRYIIRYSLLLFIVSLVALILATEIILHILFIIGAHKKNVKLLKAYYYYAVIMLIVTIVMSVVATYFLIHTFRDNTWDFQYLLAADVFSFVFSIVVQIFLVLSLWSEIVKLRSNCPYRFVRNENEPEGTINSLKDEEELSMDNGTVQIL